MKHPTRNKAILVMLLILVLTTAVRVKAQTTTEDETTQVDDNTTTDDNTHTAGDDGSGDDSNNREVNVNVMAFYAEIESQLESGGTEDSFKIEVVAGSDGVQFKVGFETETGVNETGREFEVNFKELIEYLDVNGNGVYDDSIDTEVQTLMLNSFNPIAYTVENTADGPVHVFDVVTTDGVFGAKIYAAGAFTDINGSLIAPTQVKIDVAIRGFNFTESASQLALKVEFSSESEASYDGVTEDEEDGRAVGESAVDVSMTDVNGFFSWKQTAMIDGVLHQVNSSIHEMSATEQDIYLNYPQGNEIIHDPKIGFENLLIAGGNPLPIVGFLSDNLVPISAGAAIIILGAIVVVKRRS